MFGMLWDPRHHFNGRNVDVGLEQCFPNFVLVRLSDVHVMSSEEIRRFLEHQMSKCSCGDLFWCYLLDQLILEAFHCFDFDCRRIGSLQEGERVSPASLQVSLCLPHLL